MGALEVANLLAADSIGVAVLHTPTVNRLTKAAVLREALRSGRLVMVAENHSRVGGLGEAVASPLMRSGVHPAFDQIPLPDGFLAAGA